VVVATVPFRVVPRSIIDGRPAGFCKLIVESSTHRMLGCHIVGERAVEIAQVAAVAVAAAMKVEEFVRIPLSFPTYTNVLGRAALDAAHQLGVTDFRDTPEPARS
jgi:pyruvate/2-oxoglutarate dehydrogenase complex dihydrolipoamide dehydrogenase (E3) component